MADNRNSPKKVVRRSEVHESSGTHLQSVGGQTEVSSEFNKTEVFAIATDIPTDQTFMLMGNLVHVDGMKVVNAKCSKENLTVETDLGKVVIKCPIPGAYCVAKDEKGAAQGRVMTLEEYKKYTTSLAEKNAAVGATGAGAATPAGAGKPSATA